MNPLDILKEILMAGAAPAGQGAPQQTQPKPAPTEVNISRQAKELEDIFGVGTGSAGTTPSNTEASKPMDWTLPQPERKPPARPTFNMEPAETTSGANEGLVLLRAMILAAKADGRLSQEEQQAILSRIGDRSPEALRFLEQEFQSSIDLRDFVWSVPIGLENKVYSTCIATMEPDTRAETEFLRELAHGLRLPDEIIGHIHRKFGLQAGNA